MKKDEEIVRKLLTGKPKKEYEGKDVVVIAGEIHVLPDNEIKAKEMLNKLIADHPNVTPTITFVPRHGIYILFLKK